MRSLPLILAVFLALVAAACGSGGSESAASALADDPNRPTSFEDLEFESPIADMLGFDFGDNDAMEQQFADMQRRAEEVVATCMIDQGFEYTPQIMDQGVFVGGPFAGGDGLAYYSDEWIAKYGFGVSTQRFSQSEVGPDLVGFDDPAMPDFDEGPQDPNQAYLDTLTDGEREAYEEALWGSPPDFSSMSEDELENMIFEPEGCQGEAFEQVYSEGPGGGGMEFFEAFGDELEAMEERAEADPRVVEYRADVAACVSDKGFVWDGDQDPWEYFEPKLSGIGNSGFMSDPFEGTDLNPEEMSDRELDEFFRDLNKLSEEDRAKLAAVQAEEIELATIVVGCGGGELNEQYFLGSIRLEYENEFMAQNADALAEFAE